MKCMYFTISVSDFDIEKKKLLKKNKSLSIPYVERTIYKDEDLTMIDMMIEDNTRRCNKYDGIICFDLSKIEIPTTEFINYFIEFINYYATSANVLVLGNEIVNNKIAENEGLKYRPVRLYKREVSRNGKTLY